MNAGIYLIRCTENWHFYFGRSQNIEKRINDHRRDLHEGKHKNPRMQKCFDKHGMDSFKAEILVSDVPNVEKQKVIEQEMLNLLIKDPRCMNMNRSAETFCDVEWTEERKRKISETRTGKKYGKRDPSVGQKIAESLRGQRHSDERKRKIAEAHAGKTLSDSHKETLRRRFSGEGNPMSGRTGGKNPMSRPVLQTDPHTGEVVKRFASPYDAAKALGKNVDTIRKARKNGGLAYGYRWNDEV